MAASNPLGPKQLLNGNGIAKSKLPRLRQVWRQDTVSRQGSSRDRLITKNRDLTDVIVGENEELTKTQTEQRQMQPRPQNKEKMLERINQLKEFKEKKAKRLDILRSRSRSEPKPFLCGVPKTSFGFVKPTENKRGPNNKKDQVS